MKSALLLDEPLRIAAPSPRPPEKLAKRKLRVKIPRAALPLLKPMRLKGLKGGRGGGKSHTAAELQLIAQVRNPNRNLVYIREVQKSIKDSVYRLLKDKIKALGLQKHFDIKSNEIRSSKGSGVILFIGMADHTAVTIKSLEGMDCAVVEEAQTISQHSIDMLLPTIRKEGAEVWFIWNPKNKTDPVDKLLCGDEHPADSIVVEMNYKQNVHASKTMVAEAERCRLADLDAYNHIWGGGYEEHSEARIFKHIRIESFETPPDAILRFGLDWGFTDPLVLLRGFIGAPRTLYIDYEAWEENCEISDMRPLFLTVPQSERYWITAGRDRPERIKDANKQGFKVKACVGGNNSAIEGVEFLKDYTIVIHPRCPHAIDEFTNYKRPIDKLTGKVIPVLPSKKNHIIEAARYMVEDVRRFAQREPTEEIIDPLPVPTVHSWGGRRG